MASDKIVKIGIDLDGVVTYNPFRITRPIVSLIKSKIFHKKKVGFFVPINRWQKWIYELVIVRSSFFPAISVTWLRQFCTKKRFKLVLITGRYAFTKQSTLRWLAKWKLDTFFEKVYINENNEQSHLYKERLIKMLKLDYYIDDNWDIAEYLSQKKLTKVFWIFNISDRKKNYGYKFSGLKKALEAIINEVDS